MIFRVPHAVLHADNYIILRFLAFLALILFPISCMIPMNMAMNAPPMIAPSQNATAQWDLTPPSSLMVFSPEPSTLQIQVNRAPSKVFHGTPLDNARPTVFSRIRRARISRTQDTSTGRHPISGTPSLRHYPRRTSLRSSRIGGSLDNQRRPVHASYTSSPPFIICQFDVT